MRVALFSPLPPVRSGIADYTAELLGELAARHSVDVFVATDAEREAAPAAAEYAVRRAHDFVWARERTPYDVVVYQMGNAWCHDYMWPYLFRWPGLVVLHDAHLHHARAWSLLRRRREADYRAELAYSHPTLPAEAAEAGLSGFAGPLYYFWPMLASVVRSARAVAVHNPVLAADLRAEFATTAVHAVPMGVTDPLAAHPDPNAIRARHGLGPDTVVLAALGAVTPEKRIEPAIRALAVARRYTPDIRLLLVGQALPHFDADAVASAAGVADLVTHTGYVPDAELPAYLTASDVVLSLRWPSGRETSASWLRAIAAGRPTLVTDLAQQGDVPTLDPRTWTVQHTQPTLATLDPVAVAIEPLDEAHSLTVALKRLVADRALRDRLGAAARRYWLSGHTLGHMAAAYEAVLDEAARRPDPDVDLPPHLRPDPAALAKEVLSHFPGVTLF